MQGALPTLINLNLLLERSDPIIHITHDQLFSTTCALLSRFATPDIVKQYKQGETISEITELIQDPDNLVAQDKLFLGCLARSEIKNCCLREIFLNLSMKIFSMGQFSHKEAFLYAVKWFP